MADTYKWIVLDKTVKRLFDGASIPNDPGNRDWIEFQEWKEAGGMPEDADPVREAIPEPDVTNAKSTLKNKNASTDERLDALIELLRIF